MRVPTPQEYQKFLAYTYGTISMIDDGVGKILAALKSYGLEKNTMVIFTSDHGDFMGDHGVMLKGIAHYQGVIKVPLIWKVPGLTKPGTLTNSLASSIDIPTTILNLLDIKSKHHPPGMQGYNLAPILINPEKKVRDHCIIEEDEGFETIPAKLPQYRARTMIKDDYRITIYHGHEKFGDLFDLKNDPNELNNLWNDPSSKENRPDSFNINDLDELALRWKNEGFPYFIVEGLQEIQKAFVRHPPKNIKIENPVTLAFLLLAGFHFGGNWCHWLTINVENELIMRCFESSFSVSYRGPLYRSLFALQYLEDNKIITGILESGIVDEASKKLIESYVTTGNFLEYLTKTANEDKGKTGQRAASVIKEINQYCGTK